MNRQNIKSQSGAMILLIVLGALLGCSAERLNYKTPTEPASIEVFVHGPVNMKLPSRDDGTDGISVSIPKSDEKPDKREHELVSPDWSTNYPEKNEKCDVTFRVTLEGVEAYRGKPSISKDFQSITFHVPDWKPKDPFVTMSFPSTESIGYLGPLYPVRFKSGASSQVPLTEVLDFKAKDIRNVQLVQVQVTRCEGEKPVEKKNVLRPMACEDAREKYKAYSDTHPPSGKTEYMQGPSLKKKLQGCARGTYFYFLGVGLPYKEAKFPQNMKHGVDFFNDRLLPEIFGSRESVPEGRKLVSVGPEASGGKDRSPSGPARSMLRSAEPWPAASTTTPDAYGEGQPMLLPAKFTYSSPGPRLRPVASTENCNSPGTISP
jgi:hypothetical protein